MFHLRHLRVMLPDRGVITENVSASGNVTLIVSGEHCSQGYMDALLVSDYCQRYSYTFPRRGGDV